MAGLNAGLTFGAVHTPSAPSVTIPRLSGMGNPFEQTVSRREASRLTGLSSATLKKMALQRRGPAFIKLGASKQARVLYRLADLERWQRDPAGYEAKHRGPKHGK